MIEEYIPKGAQNAITGRELSEIMHIDIRSVTEQIERARRAGIPICANTQGAYPGYYIASSKAEIKAYTDALKGRAIEIFKTREALLKAAENLPETLC